MKFFGVYTLNIGCVSAMNVTDHEDFMIAASIKVGSDLTGVYTFLDPVLSPNLEWCLPP